MPLHVPVPTVISCAEDVLPCLEGDYSSYSQKWVSAALGIGLITLDYGRIDIVGKRVYLKGNNNRYVILNLDDGTIVDQGDSTQLIASTLSLDGSSLSTYVIFVLDATHIRIYRGGTLLQTLTIAGVDVRCGVCMSYNGQFIIAYDSNDKKIYCFEGS